MKSLFYFLLLLLFSFHTEGHTAYSAFRSLQEQVAQIDQTLTKVTRHVIHKDQSVMPGYHRATHKGPNLMDGYVDWLYWDMRMSGTEFAYTSATPSFNNYHRASGIVLDVHPKMASGFRIGLGKLVSDDQYRIGIDFYRFKTTGSRQATAGYAGTLYPTKVQVNQPPNVAVGFAKSSVSARINDLSLSLSKDFSITKNFSLSPLASMKTLWFSYKQWTRYSGGDFLSPENATVYISDLENFWGLGPSLGLQSKWLLKWNTHIDAKIDASIPYGFVKVRLYKDGPTYSLNDPTNISLTRPAHHAIPVLHGKLGFVYSSGVLDYNTMCHLGLFYETSYWFGANQTMYLSGDYNQRLTMLDKNMLLHGLTTRLAIHF